MRKRTLRSLTAIALVGTLYLPKGVLSQTYAASAKPFAGQTVNVQEAGFPPPASALAQFTAQTGIKVTWVNIGWDALQTKITAAMVAHSYFGDVTDVDWSRVGQFYKLHWFMPLNKYFDVATLRKDVPQLGTFVDKGTLVGMPVDASFMVTTVNTADFTKAGITAMPKTLATYQADLAKLRARGVSAHPLGIPFSAAEGLSTYWYETTNAFGGSMLDASFKPLFTDPKSAGYRAFNWLVSAYKSGLVPRANINMADSAVQTNEMAVHRVSSIFSDYSGNIATLYDVPNSSKIVGQTEYIDTPGVNGPTGNLSNQDGMGIPLTAKNPGAAAEFIKWYISTENQANWYGLNGAKNGINGFTMPMRLSSLQLLIKAGKLPQGQQLLALLKQSKPVFVNGTPPWYSQFSASVNTNLHNAALGSESVATAISNIAQTVNSLR
jgi:multiple sugar transport system substrate-binding protein